MIGERQIKANDLGAFLEDGMKDVLTARNCLFWRMHTIRSYPGVSNPCDFIVLDEKFTALLECKATTKDRFSCADFRQVKHFEKSAKFSHIGRYGVVVYFHSDTPTYVYAGDKKVIENKEIHRQIRVAVPESYDLSAASLDELIELISKL